MPGAYQYLKNKTQGLIALVFEGSLESSDIAYGRNRQYVSFLANTDYDLLLMADTI